MNFGGLFILMVMGMAGVFGIIMIAAHANTTAPVDTYGTTTSIADNTTRSAAINMTPMILPVAGGISLFIGAIIVIGIVVYFAGVHTMNKSRY